MILLQFTVTDAEPTISITAVWLASLAEGAQEVRFIRDGFPGTCLHALTVNVEVSGGASFRRARQAFRHRSLLSPPNDVGDADLEHPLRTVQDEPDATVTATVVSGDRL